MKKKPEAPKMRKVTLMLPADLIDRAMKVTGKGLTPTIRESLEHTARSDAYEQLRALRGKLKLTLDLDELRADRDHAVR